MSVGGGHEGERGYLHQHVFHAREPFRYGGGNGGNGGGEGGHEMSGVVSHLRGSPSVSGGGASVSGPASASVHPNHHGNGDGDGDAARGSHASSLSDSSVGLRRYKIADILSPADQEFLHDDDADDRGNWGDVAADDVRGLFGDAGLLVHDTFDVFGLGLHLGSELYSGKPCGLDHLVPDMGRVDEVSRPRRSSPSVSVGVDRVRHDVDGLGYPSSDDVSIATTTATTTFADFPMEEFSQHMYVKSGPLVDDEPLKSNKELIESTLKNFDLTGPHEAYLNKMTNSDLSYHMYPFAKDIESNEVVKILLKYSQGCSYLLTSLLSCSATFQFVQTRKVIHEQNSAKYTSVTLKLLSEAFPQEGGASNSGSGSNGSNTRALANDIEKLLLTILVLTSTFTAMAYFQNTAVENQPQSQQQSQQQTQRLPPSRALSWKTHLRGVKDLLLKYTDITQKNHGGSHAKCVSDGLALARVWFFAIESVAELNDPLGGTLKYSKKNISTVSDIIKTDAELDRSDMGYLWLQTGYFNREKNKEYHDALLRIGLITPPPSPPIPSHVRARSVQFNMYIGCSVYVVKLIDEFTKCLDLLRDSISKREDNNVNDKVHVKEEKHDAADHHRVDHYSQISGTRVAHIMSLIDSARQNEIVPGVKRENFMIPSTSPAHPHYSKPDKIHLPSSCYGQELTPQGEQIYYSWFDLSEQIHVDSFCLKLFTTRGLMKLARSHPLVNELKIRLLNGMFYIKSKPASDPSDIYVETQHYYTSKRLFDARAMMVQSCYRACSKLRCEDDEFEKLELYFRSLVKFGNGSSMMALDHVCKMRAKAREEREKVANGNVELRDEESDEVSNIDIIPFA
ncbi:uncharacterized protein LODBEIA_P22180 [Lodderomyces beijingensis]|uniref:Uncharacterized protein n=1 Tax=Lodderomyces beijingensis TaxID=1775926 RepID=A0ABP0ZIM0_9ASCO